LITGSKLYKKPGKYVEVEPFYQRALAIYTKVSGDEDTNGALVLNNLAELYLYEGRYPAAEPLFKRALDIRTKY
jgi:tetratricopeptide (TPR) repeat protein